MAHPKLTRPPDTRTRLVFHERVQPELLHRARDLLGRFGVQVAVAEHRGQPAPGLVDALRCLERAGVTYGLWPLLRPDEGYWLSSSNLEAATDHALGTLREHRAQGLRPRFVCLDVEPPLNRTRALHANPGRVSSWLGLIPRPRRTSLRPLVEALRAEGCATRTVGWPLPRGLGAALGLPAADADMKGAMLYSSVFASFVGPAAAQHALALGSRAWRRAHGARASIGLGCVGTGALDDEATWSEPGELARDVACVRAAGIDDISLFCLEGLMETDCPEAWLAALVR